jgi:hypothetical protein
MYLEKTIRKKWNSPSRLLTNGSIYGANIIKFLVAANGMAKPYQVRQLLSFIEDNNLDVLE